MKKKLLTLIFTGIGMTNFAQAQNSPLQEAPVINLRQQIALVQKQMSECVNQDKMSDAAKVVNEEVFEIVPKSVHKENLFLSKNTITDEESAALISYLDTSHQCRVISSQFPVPELKNIYASFYKQVDLVYAELLSKKITIGEANKEKYQLIQTAQSQWLNYASENKVN